MVWRGCVQLSSQEEISTESKTQEDLQTNW